MMSFIRFYCYKCPIVVEVGRWVLDKDSKYPVIINGMFDDPVYIPGVMGVIFVLLFTIHNYFLSIRSMPFFILIALMLTVVALLKNYQQQRRMIVLRYFWANYTFVKPRVSDHRCGDGGKNEFSLEKTNSQFVMASERERRSFFLKPESPKKSLPGTAHGS